MDNWFEPFIIEAKRNYLKTLVVNIFATAVRQWLPITLVCALELHKWSHLLLFRITKEFHDIICLSSLRVDNDSIIVSAPLIICWSGLLSPGSWNWFTLEHHIHECHAIVNDIMFQNVAVHELIIMLTTRAAFGLQDFLRPGESLFVLVMVVAKLARAY